MMFLTMYPYCLCLSLCVYYNILVRLPFLFVHMRICFCVGQIYMVPIKHCMFGIYNIYITYYYYIVFDKCYK